MTENDGLAGGVRKKCPCFTHVFLIMAVEIVIPVNVENTLSIRKFTIHMQCETRENACQQSEEQIMNAHNTL